MCGILGVLRAGQEPLGLGVGQLEAMRDVMTPRGPDAAGLWMGDGCALAHRRLAVMDPGRQSDQPMLTPDRGHALVYNGELYNDDELRRDLQREGVVFRGRSDTETVLRALERWGVDAIPRFRGMYALGFLDIRARNLILTRDPLGIKPLYWARPGDRELVFASDPAAILRHPRMSARPDAATISAYLTTIRTTLGERTLFQGVSAVRPGHVLEIGFGSGEITLERGRAHSRPVRGFDADAGVDVTTERIRRCVEDSVRRHVRADVPVCALLSGGLDSSIIAMLADRDMGPLRTYCSGAEARGDGDEHGGSEDFAFARVMAARLGSVHAEVPITRAAFARRWPEMIAQQGLPLSTPNEVAINAVAERLRADGQIVALSGEGADELFGGYAGPLLQAAAFEARDGRRDMHPGDFQLLSNAWIAPELKPVVLAPEFARGIEGDEALRAHYREEFDAAAAESPGDSPLQPHLRFHRRCNLAGLLQRLDTATMLAGVEGRTPLADIAVMELAESLPMSMKFVERGGGEGAAPLTKHGLRRAFAPDLPESIVGREKASFPLPFQVWIADQAPALARASFARELFSPDVIELVARDPAAHWKMAWPMMNIAHWAQRWWG